MAASGRFRLITTKVLQGLHSNQEQSVGLTIDSDQVSRGLSVIAFHKDGSAAIACCHFLGCVGGFFDFWHALLWLLALVVIEMNLLKWQEKAKLMHMVKAA